MGLDDFTRFGVACRGWGERISGTCLNLHFFFASTDPNASGARPDLVAKEIQERFTAFRQPLLEPLGTIAGAAGPNLRAIFISTAAAIMRVLHAREIEILFPIGTLLEQRAGTITHLNPARRAILADPGVLHIAQIFAFGHRSAAKRATLDRSQQVRLATGFHSRTNEITHGLIVALSGHEPLVLASNGQRCPQYV